MMSTVFLTGVFSLFKKTVETKGSRLFCMSMYRLFGFGKEFITLTNVLYTVL